ncbi:family 78 glycoside hydrolase catalytic domain [Sphingobacterium yanglingense]|uniref:alpha-L-rhamnosidase n=1 Tax=Sphingobacterium yanglingense TaxID=1437280 RepID=A0A4R6WIU4_9SPHI|nr:family 78 glycoside hydrolase catalytic domain [Sphingobacterium yanglingense]TDQ80163.1 alpha-L-rhamnosidase [Sphingobacterium yanglingense]
MRNKQIHWPLLCLITFLLLTCPITLFAKASVSTSGLLVEYLSNPIGVDNPNPMLSWKLKSLDKNRYGQKQTAYRILVASEESLLHRHIGDYWDTGWINSGQSQQHIYQGKPLQSDRSYYWKVKVKDENGNEADWSPSNHWHMGLLQQSDWKAEWIGSETLFDPAQEDCNIVDPWFRKSFQLSKKPQQAFLHVASVGFHDLFVNGKKVSTDVMATAVTDHTKRARYVSYDIGPYLQKGVNVIGIWLGTGWSIHGPYVGKHRPNTPIVIAQLACYAHRHPGAFDQPFFRLSTDSSWKYKHSPNKLLGTWDTHKMGGELWDANEEDPDWNTSKYKDTDWKKAVQYNPKLKLSWQQVEGNSVLDEIRPISISMINDSSYLIDMGVNFAGWTSLNLEGKPGQRANIYFSEREGEKMTFGIRSGYIFDKTGKGTFTNRFNYSSGRWITIEGLTKKPDLNDIKGWLVRTNYTDHASFSCSDSLHNWIYNTVKWTYENLSLGGFIVDCPQRERLGYGGDAHATCETGMLNYGTAAFYRKWMEDWRDVAGTESIVGDMYDASFARKAVMGGRALHKGILPHTAPTYMGGGGPAWGGIVVSLPWYYYQQYNDVRILKENYDLIKNWMEFLDSHTKDGLLQRFGGKWDFLGDWLWPNATEEGMNNDSPQNLCFNNLYRIYNLKTAIEIARVIGQDQQVELWEQQVKQYTEAINEAYFDTKTVKYADGAMGNTTMALLADVVPQDYKENIWEQLEREIIVQRKGHIHVGITGGAMLFKLLRDHNRNDLIYSMTSKDTYPSWGYMKANNATTIWEMWEKDLPGHSLLHSSFLYPGAWYMDGVAGIKVHKPGYEEFVIEPPAATSTHLTWVKAHFESPYGTIRSNWKRTAGQLAMEIEVPVNTNAILKLKTADQIVIPVDGKHIQLIREDKKERIYQLASGSYNF